jgi:hypothetical protein
MRRRNFFFALASVGVAGLAGLTIFLTLPRPLPDFPALDPAKYPNCVLKPVPADHVLIEATAISGAVLTNILFEPKNGKRPDSSAVIHVEVAQGTRPITLVAAGMGGMIWEFTGDVQRVERVVALSRDWDRNVAIGGISKDRIEFIDLERCPSFGYATGDTVIGDVRPQQQWLQLMFGRKADSVAWYGQAHTLTLPDGTWKLAPAGAARFRALDPKDYISPVSLSVLNVKPARAGIEDYERDGTIRAPRPDEVEKFIAGASTRYRSKISPDYRIRTRFDYVVTRPMEMPVGMFGVASLHFLVLEGVPPPKGERSHNCIALMDGFRMEDPVMCVGSPGVMIAKLENWPKPAELEGCKIWRAPEGASLQAVSTSGPDPERDQADRGTPASPILVRVKKPGDIVLILQAYHEVNWRIHVDAASRVVGVVMIGFKSGRLEGLDADTALIDLSEANRETKIPPNCWTLRQYVAAYDGNVDATVFERQVEGLLGREIDGFYGDFKLRDVVIR